MKIGTLFHIELLKAVRRRAFWVALGFLALLSTVATGSEFLQGREGDSAPWVPPFTWGMETGTMGPMPAVFIALTLVMLVTSEYSWRTARQNVIDGLSKEQFFVAKWLTTMMVVFAFCALPYAVATGTALYGRMTWATPAEAPASASARTAPEASPPATDSTADSARQAAAAAPIDSARAEALRRADSTQAALRQALRDARQSRPRPIYPPADPTAPLVSAGDLKAAAGFTLGSLGFGAFAFMLAMLLRSTGGAIGVFFLYFAFLEQLITLLVGRTMGREFVQTVSPYFPVNALRAPMDAKVWHPELLERLNAIGASMGQPAQAVEFDAMKLVGVPLIWIAVFVGVTFAVFRKRDL